MKRIIKIGLGIGILSLAGLLPSVSSAYGYSTCYSQGYYVCYQASKAYCVNRGQCGWSTYRYLGIKNHCIISAVPCSTYYSTFKYGWYPTCSQARAASYECNQHWYRGPY